MSDCAPVIPSPLYRRRPERLLIGQLSRDPAGHVYLISETIAMVIIVNAGDRSSLPTIDQDSVASRRLWKEGDPRCRCPVAWEPAFAAIVVLQAGNEILFPSIQ